MKEVEKSRLFASKPLIVFLVLIFFCSVNGLFAAETSDDYLSTDGSVIYDEAGNPVRLTGIAWFGFETENQVYHMLMELLRQ